MLKKSAVAFSILLLVILGGCADPRTHAEPHADLFQVGLFGHGRGVLGDIRLNVFALERRCDTCHQTPVKQHGDLGTCNSCHQPHYLGWHNTLYAREHGEVMSFKDKSYHQNLKCTQCHQEVESREGFKQVSCNHCHNHGRSDMEYAHDLMDGYDYQHFSNNQNCVSCHSRSGKLYSEYHDEESGELL